MQTKPYYVVIFTSKKSNVDEGYKEMSDLMLELSKKQKGFIAFESARGPDGLGITTSYWETLEDISAWKKNTEHLNAQKLGKSIWYESYTVRICKVEREYSMIQLRP